MNIFSFSLPASTQKILDEARNGWGIALQEEREKISQKIEALYRSKLVLFPKVLIGLGVANIGLSLTRLSWLSTPEADFKENFAILLIGFSAFTYGIWLYPDALETSSRRLVGELAEQRWKRYYPDLFEQGSSRVAVLQVQAEHDHNGAFSRAHYPELEILRQLSKKYIIYKRTVSSVADINKVIDWIKSEKNKTIQLLWIRAHGSPTTVCFSKELTQGVSLSGIDYFKLASHATIWLQSCSTGANPGTFKLSVAEHVKLAAGPHRKVFAPSGITSTDAFELVDSDTCTPKIYASSLNVEHLMYGNFDCDKLITVEPTVKSAKQKLSALTSKSKQKRQGFGQRIVQIIRTIARTICGHRR